MRASSQARSLSPSLAKAIAAPYNFTTKYQPEAFARYDALTSELRSANIGLVGAMKVTDWLDIGAGFDAQYAKAKLPPRQYQYRQNNGHRIGP